LAHAFLWQVCVHKGKSSDEPGSMPLSARRPGPTQRVRATKVLARAWTAAAQKWRPFGDARYLCCSYARRRHCAQHPAARGNAGLGCSKSGFPKAMGFDRDTSQTLACTDRTWIISYLVMGDPKSSLPLKMKRCWTVPRWGWGLGAYKAGRGWKAGTHAGSCRPRRRSIVQGRQKVRWGPRLGALCCFLKDPAAMLALGPRTAGPRPGAGLASQGGPQGGPVSARAPLPPRTLSRWRRGP
jgi:hypothetical protein